MRLTRFEAIQYRVFRDFTWSPELDDFSDFNLIYSPNGSGKSTLADVLRRLMRGENLPEGSAVLSTSAGRIEISSTTVPGGLSSEIRVFDPEYRSENLGNFAGIHWSIGKEAVDAAGEIERLSAHLTELDGRIAVAKAKAQADDRGLVAFCDTTAAELRGLKRLLPGQGATSYSSASLRARLDDFDATMVGKCVLQAAEAEASRLLLQDRSMLGQVDLSGRSGPVDLSPLARSAHDLLLAAAAVGEESSPEISADLQWLAQGMRYWDAEVAHVCPFCGQTIPEGREVALRQALGARYEELVGRAQELQRALAVDVEFVGLPIPNAIVATKRSQFELALAEFRDSLPEYQQGLRDIQAQLALVAEGHVTAAPPEVQYEGTAHALWKQIVAIVAEHNAEVVDLGAAYRSAFDRLEAHTLAQALGRYRKLTQGASDSRRMVGELEAQRTTASAERRRIEASLRRIDRAVDVLNEDLAAYLGHPHIRVEILGDGYQIVREGVPASAVSEGERTAITLLHFLRSLDDEGFDRNNGLVVIDDPVSSLDSTALCSAAAFITDAVFDRDNKSVRGQVFVATHNFTFFRLLRDWAIHLRKPTRKFYTIRTTQTASGRSSVLRPIDQLLLEFDSEYHFLFSRVHGYTGGEEALYILNLARRLLEAFLAFRVPSRNDLRVQLDELLAETEGVGSEQQQRLRMLFNIGSHAASIPEMTDQLAHLDEVPSAIEALNTLMRAADPRHYQAMVDVCARHQGGRS